MEIHTLINKITDCIKNQDLDIDYIFRQKYTDLEALKSELNTSIEVVHQEGGLEGDGSYACGVLYFPEYDIYLKSVGKHNSYEGVYYDNVWTQVFPKQVTITVYTDTL